MLPDVNFALPSLPAKVIDTGSQKILTLPPLRKAIPEVTLKSLSTHPRRVNVDVFTDLIPK